MLRAILALAALASCSDLKPSLEASNDGGLTATSDAASDATEWPTSDAAVSFDGSVKPGAPCRELVPSCLDASLKTVHEVPTEMTMDVAIATAKAGETIQIKGASLGSGWRVPAYATLRGCAGAKITGSIGAAGSGGTIEGFEVSGSIVLNQTGTFIVRWNRFLGTKPEEAIAVESIDGLVSADVKAIIEQNAFVGRQAAIVGNTRYDTMVHRVDLTIRNNTFVQVLAPVLLSRSGLVGKVSAQLVHNTFTQFETAVALYGLQEPPTLTGNIFAVGTKAVEGASPFNQSYNLLHASAAGSAPALGGAFATGDPRFVSASDVQIGPGSAALDRIPTSSELPAEDFAGCPRPKGHGGTPLSDIGAYEAE